jgi:predicted GH43/DUF377 family glycosyl hydrolase
MKLIRFDGNPILEKKDVSFRVNSIFNPGAVKFGDKYLLLCRIEMPNGRSALIKAISSDGYNFIVSDTITISPEDHADFYKYVEWGVEDARIIRIDSKYYITYTGYSKYMPLVMLAETTDFEKFIFHGPVSEPSNKDCTLFPEKINGFYCRLDRPTAEDKSNIWYAESSDLIHWGRHKVVAEPQAGSWEQDKIGTSSTPIRTKNGWLLLYHGVRGFGITSNIYKLGVMLLDLEKPWLILGRSNEPILQPDFGYERTGDVNNVVFCNGWIVEPEGKVMIYYSGADMNICLAETSVEYLLSLCLTDSQNS